MCLESLVFGKLPFGASRRVELTHNPVFQALRHDSDCRGGDYFLLADDTAQPRCGCIPPEPKMTTSEHSWMLGQKDRKRFGAATCIVTIRRLRRHREGNRQEAMIEASSAHMFSVSLEVRGNDPARSRTPWTSLHIFRIRSLPQTEPEVSVQVELTVRGPDARPVANRAIEIKAVEQAKTQQTSPIRHQGSPRCCKIQG